LFLDDREFLRAFHEGELESLHHKDHLRIAWTVLRSHSIDEAKVLVSQGIKDFAEAKGARGLYHETLTQFWIRIVHHAIQASPNDDFESLVQKHPVLLDKAIPLRHWSRETLASPESKAAWVAPDILPLP